MRKSKKLLSCALALTMIMGMTACSDDNTNPNPNNSTNAPANGQAGDNSTSGATTTAMTTVDPNEKAKTDEEAKDIASSDFAPDGNAGTLEFLGYYDITDGSDQYLTFQTEQWGGTIEWISCGSGAAYTEKLATLIAADDSPDLVTYEWVSFPGNMSKNMYEPLDDYFDLDTALWADMKSSVEDFSYNGKHYYYPYRIKSNFALNYNRKTVLDAGLEDPYDLYMAGNWTWDTWREMMIEFCNQDETNIGYCSTADVIAAFVATTGTNFVDVKPDGTIENNLGSANVSRAMTFVENLHRDGLMYNKELGDWVPPTLWATNSEQVLFLGMEPSWAYSDATKAIQNPTGVDNDVHDTVSDFAFVPFPRDPSSDVYYQAYDTFGYMVPKGAQNIKGAVDWIYCNRIYETDENVKAVAKQEAVHPEEVYYVEGTHAGKRKWQMMWDERVYDLWIEMQDPEKFSFSFDDCYGFNDELSSTIIGYGILTEIMFNGASYTQLSNEYMSAVESILDEYR
ncbi:MAG: extracellular solute-binding protein [Ruminococcaceae bacterium]|nr:extracellular solute-binding protein [Oscillospiraceae bacterium]